MPSRYSYLFVPATKADAFLSKLRSSPEQYDSPYGVIFDIEDSIREPHKALARELVQHAISQYFNDFGDRFRWHIRINDCSTPFFHEDLEWLKSMGNDSIAIKLPKCRNREDIVAAQECHKAEAPMIPTIETLEGYGNRDDIMAQAGQIGVETIGFGAGDMALELDVERDYTLPVLRHIICELIIAAKRHGLKLIDSTSRVLPRAGTDWRSLVAQEAAFACANGFAGKKAIHPAQVPLIERAFDSDENADRARKLVEDFDNGSPTRAVRSSETGNYVGAPSLKQAERLLQRHDLTDHLK